MRLNTKNSVLFTLLWLAAALLIGCGNKGELYLDSNESILESILTIDDALNELEEMEEEEESS